MNSGFVKISEQLRLRCPHLLPLRRLFLRDCIFPFFKSWLISSTQQTDPVFAPFDGRFGSLIFFIFEVIWISHLIKFIFISQLLQMFSFWRWDIFQAVKFCQTRISEKSASFIKITGVGFDFGDSPGADLRLDFSGFCYSQGDVIDFIFQNFACFLLVILFFKTIEKFPVAFILFSGYRSVFFFYQVLGII